MAFPFLLLATTAAGLGMKAFSQSQSNQAEDAALREQDYFSNLGFDIAKNEIGLRMDQETLAAEEQNLFSINRLRDVLSTQRAMMGARGQRSGVGSAGAIQNKAINVYNADEKSRNLNESFRKMQLQGQFRSLSIKQLTGQSRTSNFKSKRNLKQTQDWLKTGTNMFTQALTGMKNPGVKG